LVIVAKPPAVWEICSGLKNAPSSSGPINGLQARYDPFQDAPETRRLVEISGRYMLIFEGSFMSKCGN
jgi:hypothetical protein